jgi:tryptophan-rich sensory protein
MGMAAWLVWRQHGFRESRWALWLFLGQLAANALWSWLFFAWQAGAWASAEILMLWLLILGTITAFWRIRRLASVLPLPYLAWVTFATALCWKIWRSNPLSLGG